MTDRPVTRRMFAQLLLDDSLSRESVRAVLQRLLEVDPLARKELSFALRHQSLYSEPTPRLFAGNLQHNVRARSVQVEEWKREAKQDFTNLMKLAPELRGNRIERAFKRYRSPWLTDLLIAESRSRLPTEPERAAHVGELATIVAMRISTERFPRGLTMTAIARAQANRGNILRACGRLDLAEPLLEAAVQIQMDEGDGDLLVEAELMNQLAALRLQQERYKDCERLLERILQIYQACSREDETTPERIREAIQNRRAEGPSLKTVRALQAAVAAAKATCWFEGPI